MLVGIVGCGGSKSSGKIKTKVPVVEDVLNKVYNYFTENDSDLVSKLEFLDNDTVRITKVDGSSETLKQENLDEGEEDDTDLLLENICTGTATGTTAFVDIRLTQTDGTFASNLGSEVWEGTCNGQTVSCAAVLVYDVDPVEENSTPVQAYLFGLNNEAGCDPIQAELETLLESVINPT